MSRPRTWLRLTKQRPRRRTARPALEQLEDRCLLSVVTEFPIATPASRSLWPPSDLVAE